MKFADWFKREFSVHDSYLIYVLKTAEENVVYVGRTTSFRLMQRMNSHWRNSEWFHQVEHCELLEYPSSKEADEAERALIRYHKPLQNIKDNEQQFKTYHGRPHRDPRSWQDILAGAPYPDDTE